jgi:hypothetical protein
MAAPAESAKLGAMLPDLPTLRLVTRSYAEVVAALELESGEQPLVLPNGEWFPDTFKGDLESVERLLCRMQGYAGLEASEIAVRIGDGTDAEAAACAPGKSSGACGTGCGTPSASPEAAQLERTADGFTVHLPRALVGNPLALTSTIARLLGAVRLIEAGETQADAVHAEFSAVALGFGVLLLEGSYVYSKSCGGPSVGKMTALGCGELSWAFSLFLASEQHGVGAAKKELSTTQRALLDEAWALVQSNKKLVDRLKKDPQKVADDAFELGSTSSWLSRLFAGGAPKPVDREAEALAALERGEDVDRIAALFDSPAPKPQTAAKRERPRDDVSDLVDEALRELRG